MGVRRFSHLVLVMLALVFAGVSGCAHKTPDAAPPPPADPADTALTKAAAAIQQDLRLLAQDEYAGPVPAGNATLMKSSPIRFSGELEDFCREAARATGYGLRFNGKHPPQAIMVSVYSIDPITWFHALQSAGVQAGDRANLSIDDATKDIVVSYTGINSPKAPTKARKASARTKPVGTKGTVMPTPAQRSHKLSVPVKAKPVSDAGRAAGGFRYDGDIAGFQSGLASRLGYGTRILGEPSAMIVRVEGKDMRDAVARLNDMSREASVFVDDGNRTVVLQYWK